MPNSHFSAVSIFGHTGHLIHPKLSKVVKMTQVSIDMGKGKGKGFSRIAKLVTASARDQQASPQQVTMMVVVVVVVVVMVVMMVVVQEEDKNQGFPSSEKN